jgi:hypothetical protein
MALLTKPKRKASDRINEIGIRLQKPPAAWGMPENIHRRHAS